MKDKSDCFWCEKEIEYDFVKDTINQWDYNSAGEIIDWYEIFCPHCNLMSRIF